MRQIRQYFFPQIPQSYQEELAFELNKENMLRMMIGQVVLIIVELLLLSIYRCPSQGLVYAFILFNALLFVVFLTVYRADSGHLLWGRVIQYLYMAGVLIYGCLPIYFEGWLGAVQNEQAFAQIFIYIIVVFAIASFVFLHPIFSFILFFAVYMLIFYGLEFFWDPVTGSLTNYIRSNALIMNGIAWVLNWRVYRSKVDSFLDKRTILEQNQKLQELTLRDSMTMLYNHKYMYQRLQEEIQRANRFDHPFSVIMIDLDDFKAVNDIYGHPVGDKIIVRVAQLLVDTCRSSDIVGRYGGEEFLIIMPDTSVHNAVRLTERIRKAVENTQFAKDIKISLSGGLCEYQGESAEDLIKKVDAQLYKAKAQGKNKFEHG